MVSTSGAWEARKGLAPKDGMFRVYNRSHNIEGYIAVL